MTEMTSQEIKAEEKRKKRLVVDFDGTLVEFDFPRIGRSRWDIINLVKKFKDLGFVIVISSGRASRCFTEDAEARALYIMDMRKFLDEIKFPYDWIDDGSWGKIPGEYYIGDEAIPAFAEDIQRVLEREALKSKVRELEEKIEDLESDQCVGAPMPC